MCRHVVLEDGILHRNATVFEVSLTLTWVRVRTWERNWSVSRIQTAPRLPASALLVSFVNGRGHDFQLQNQTNTVAFSPQANYTDWSTATGRRVLVPTFADRGVSYDQRGGSPTAVKLGFLDRSRYFSFK
jgi:hypothetical protein